MDIVVIGGGHAGIEAALASSRLGLKTLLITKLVDSIGALSCNPSIGGIGKGQLVKEIDILGGEMGRAADFSSIHSNILNLSKGPAVWSTRSQIDSNIYKQYVLNSLNKESSLTIIQDEVIRIILHKNKQIVRAIKTKINNIINCQAIIVCTGTFLKGLIHLGKLKLKGGRFCETSSDRLDQNLLEFGFILDRFKTGTSPRINKLSVDFKYLKIQHPMNPISKFSLSSINSYLPQLPCYITRTTNKSFLFLDKIIGRGKSPLYNGQINTKGPRYCPSIEDKIIKFPEKKIHQIFLEPQNLNSSEFYLNGLSTSLSPINQQYLIRTIKGLESAQIIKFGYNIEYTFVIPTQLYPTMETKYIENLFFAGQINGTTGYEEAAIQGFIAGVNATKKIQGKDPLLLHRYNSYSGILIDDLINKGVSEPYRILTSRAEYRLILREDNIISRLFNTSNKIGLNKYKMFKSLFYVQQLAHNILIFIQNSINFHERINFFIIETLDRINRDFYVSELNYSKISLLKISEKSGVFIKQYINMLVKNFKMNKYHSWIILKSVINLKYSGYIKSIRKEVCINEKSKKLRIPFSLFSKRPKYISKEVYDKLCEVSPKTIGDIINTNGITPVAINILTIMLQRFNK